MRISITGASGFIGKRLVRSLLARGDSITVLTRWPENPWPPGIRAVRGDLVLDRELPGDFLEGCDVLFHCAGEIRDPNLMRPLHVEGTRNLLRAAGKGRSHRASPLHWVQLSSVGAYGPPPMPGGDRIVDEASPLHPRGEYEETKTLADELVVETAGESGLTYTIVRPSAVLAADMPNGSLRALGRMVQRGLFFYIGKPGAIAPYVHADDVVDLLLLCAFEARARNATFNLSNDCTLEEMIAGMAAALGVRSPRFRIPEAAARQVFQLAGKVFPVPLTPQRINALVARTRYPGARLERELGFVPRRSIPTAIGEVVLAPGP
jgi:nucleoside-diphosphate-sugar epimerase